MSNSNQNERHTWSSRLTYVLTVAGATIGFGATWRFPYMVGENGGGAYVLLFCLCMIIIGIPMILVENVIGRRRQQNVCSCFEGKVQGKKVHPLWRLAAYIAMAGVFGLIAYYMVLGGWVTSYIYNIITGNLDVSSNLTTTATKAFYEKSILGSPVFITVCTIFFIVLNYFILLKGVAGIEKAVQFLMPLLFLFLIIMVIRNLTMEGAMKGIEFYLKPDFSKITPKLFIMVLGQVFFALSLGMGVLITLSSHLSREENLVKTSIITAVLNTIIAVLAGFMIFPSLFSVGLAPDSGPSLVFQTLPIVFSKMPGGAIFGVIFFCLLLVAALTTSVTLYQVLITALEERTRFTHHQSVLIVLIGSFFIGNLPSIFSMEIFDWFDYISANYCFVLAALGSVLFCVFCLKDEAKEELGYNASPKTVKVWFNYTKYCLPIIILVIFFFNFLN